MQNKTLIITKNTPSAITQKIYCCGCKKDVEAYLTSGKEIYSHREDLYDIPFWKCNNCKNFVGCHHKTHNKTKPLGCIPTYEIKQWRSKIHNILDPMWRQAKNKQKTRSLLYGKISNFIGYQYHTAEIKDVTEAQKIYNFVTTINK